MPPGPTTPSFPSDYYLMIWQSKKGSHIWSRLLFHGEPERAKVAAKSLIFCEWIFEFEFLPNSLKATSTKLLVHNKSYNKLTIIQKRNCYYNFPWGYRSVLSNWKFFIKMRAAFLALSFLHNSTRGRIAARRAALILMKNSHFDEKLFTTVGLW